MCGICGKLAWDKPAEQVIVERMSQKLIHRGPDSGGVRTCGPLTLGHRRLAIIDLSPAGNQPLSDHTGQFWIVFNGEIYNFFELRRELTTLGAQFRTDTDTEVILEAYKHWGDSFLTRLNGMFAFGLWDNTKRRLLLARDRLGKKPLYYYILTDGGVVFASELKALLEDPVVPRKLNWQALNQYLSLSYTLTEHCILQGVQKLPAAHYLTFEQGRQASPIQYWDLAKHFRVKREFRNEADAADELRALIDDAVRLRLISDVPLGLFLSGGIDSSTLAAAMHANRPPETIKSFSTGFQEKSYSELDQAREVAELLKLDHQDQVVLPDVARLLPKITWHADEPFADTSVIPTYLLAEFCRRSVTVCLSGDGGDELFAGYETYVADKLHHLSRGIPNWVTRGLLSATNQLLPVSHDKVSFDYKLRQFLSGQTFDATRAHYHWRTIFSETEKQQLLLPDVWVQVSKSDPFDAFARFQQQVADCHYLDQAMYVDIKTWLVDDILVKVDRATMAHGLEARAPLLDYRIAEFAAALPVDLKLKGWQKKYLLKQSQRERLPHTVLQRKKRGFNAPVSHWLNSALRDHFFDVSLSGQRGTTLFNSTRIKTLWAEHENKVSDHGLKLFNLINLQLWCQQYHVALA